MAEGRGDSNVLSRLRQQSAGLCRVTVTGTGDYTASSRVKGDIILRLREQLKQQRFDLRNRIGAGEISVDELSLEYITVENLKEAIRQLVLEIENAKVTYCNKSVLVQRKHCIDDFSLFCLYTRMQLFYKVQNKIQEKNTDSEFLRKITNHSFEVASVILKEQMETRALEKQLIEMREKRMALKVKSTELMTEVLSIADELRLQKEPKDQKFKKIFKYVQKETDVTFMLQNIFQRIVHGSRVNWAADPKLTEAVIKAGKDLHSF
ncbi:PREDICTED: uncharacterized protein LOC108797427 [Nanorana parkeri]|uniref:uncharacterized protein LOC108797427 n=1 Tax=Nanorana parkeri TaxID=125878 RepID=UPI0008548C4D|nr:PREDICTED: uncharacterized protein LOC108797427 [Nanorana parkeri]